MKALKKIIKEMSQARARLIFISYPTLWSLDDAYKICHYWWAKKYIPICPRIMFSYMDNDHDRPAIMAICKTLLYLCNNFALYGESRGCNEEYRLAKEWGKKIYICYDDDVNFKRMMQSNREVMLNV